MSQFSFSRPRETRVVTSLWLGFLPETRRQTLSVRHPMASMCQIYSPALTPLMPTSSVSKTTIQQVSAMNFL